MTETISEYTTFDKLNLPGIVYKYREGENSNHRTILTEQLVYFAPPNSFEDIYDCKIPVRYDLLTDDEIYENYFITLKLHNPGWTDRMIRDETTRFSNMGLLKDEARLIELERHFWNELNSRFGVLSLTQVNDNAFMWNKYSKRLNGFCVGFNPKLMFPGMGGGGLVEYVDTIPILKPLNTAESQRTIITFTKLKKWAFEKEYRVQNFWPHPIADHERRFKVNSNAYIEIILGDKIASKLKKELILESQQINPNILIKEASLKNNKILLKPFA